MKSNHERSNECLPPKKREIPSCTLPSETRSITMPPASDSQRSENMAWLASVAGNESSVGGHRSASHSDGHHYKSLSSTPDSSTSSSSLRLVSSLPTIYTSPMSQSTVGGTVHYTQLPHNLQFITSPYTAPYAGYISPQLLPPPPPPPPLSLLSPPSSSMAAQRPSHTETASAPSQASKHDQHRASSGRTSMPPPSTEPPHHHTHMSTSLRTVPSTHHQGGVHLSHQSLHHHHTLGHGMSQVLVQYMDGSNRNEDGGSRHRDLHNGELERGRRFGASPEFSLSRSGNKSREVNSSLTSYEAHQLVLPSEYPTHDPSGLRTSVMLMHNSHGDHQLVPPRASPDKMTNCSPAHFERGGIILGKPVNRTSSSSSNTTSSFTFPPPLSVDSLKAAVRTLSPQTVIQTTHSATEALSMGLPSSSIYPHSPIIGYIAGGSGSQHTSISYHTSLQQHLLIPGPQPVIIPVSGSGVTTLEPVTSHMTSSTQASFPSALPHTYIAASAPKEETLVTSSGSYHQVASGAVVPAQLHLPIVSTPPGLVAHTPPPPSNTVAPPALPPYFIKGSIIQLADGELKRVEDLKTEDFIQSAEISNELKIDSSTVERIEGSHASPNVAVVQFSVGEHRAQVSVEVLVEYPFFVFGQGWSSCCPDRTTQLLELPCTKLSVGDVCISLTLKNLRNGSLKKTQPLELATEASVPASSHGHLKPPRAVYDAPQIFRHNERENGISQRGSGGSGSGSGGGPNVANGDGMFGERGSVSKGQAASIPKASRKRRWSAPEGRKVERTEEEPPLTLPKPSFIPHEMKISIEGRSNIGK
ncbi:ataxin-1a [Pleuronectes platessa]|uniref:ataxin-1a n=1 Tax=Pleuronectes platessa TaxID=8262 RepID=UPI00232A77C6|nr:ataxin-1a [Pleuronectes platessa]XP_053301982.1 ataxin-1a [Pleuronectes platessa]XP_053301983.1 ataxin-1a [Pleuronectes platessa]XP_053301984.1 ataxin-1a [Pleuronectes platessa]XP_053301985.1 ataxin-1a [Pleuronectes platessa]